MIPTLKKLSAGALTGSIYDFTSVGDVLPMHDHDESTAHITIIARGVVKISGPGWSQENGPGDILDFAAGNPHEFEALEPGTRVINIVKGIVG